MKHKSLISLFLGIMISSCGTAQKQVDSHAPSDTTNSFKIENYWITPNKTFEFNSLRKSVNDTLHLVTCSDYVYYPFGKLTDSCSIKTSLLKDFKITENKLDTFINIMLPSDKSDDTKEWTNSLKLELDNNKLDTFLDNNPESSTHGYIRGGQIIDNNVIFSNKIRIGIRLKDFYQKFFDYFPTELSEKYSVIKLESCVTDITQIYTFEKGQLIKIKFEPN